MASTQAAVMAQTFDERLATLERQMKRLESQLDNLKAQLLGEHGDIGLLTKVEGEVKAVYNTLGKIQAQLLHMREALR
jgi:uncharacterized coiled-coil protein SlyX